jgi:hypothetical protein
MSIEITPGITPGIYFRISAHCGKKDENAWECTRASTLKQ